MLFSTSGFFGRCGSSPTRLVRPALCKHPLRGLNQLGRNRVERPQWNSPTTPATASFGARLSGVPTLHDPSPSKEAIGITRESSEERNTSDIVECDAERGRKRRSRYFRPTLAAVIGHLRSAQKHVL